MKLNVQIDTSGLNLTLENVQRNLAFSTTQAINDVAADIRTKGRGEIANLTRKVRLKGNEYGPSAFERAGGDELTGDEAQYLKRRFRILVRADAKRGRVYSVVGWRNPAGFTVGDFDTAAKLAGDQPLFLSQVGRKFLTLRELNLRTVQVTPKTTPHKVQLKGGQRTFGLFETKTFPKGAIFQRTGPGPGDLRTLLSYAQLQRERLIQRLMNLPKLAERIYTERFKLYFERRFAGLTKTGRVKKPKAA